MEILNKKEGITFLDLLEFTNGINYLMKIDNDSYEWYGQDLIQGAAIVNNILYINFCGEFSESDISRLEKIK